MSCSGSVYQVLLVEDSEDDAFFFERVARRAGCKLQITHAPNGLAAVEILKAALNAPDAVPSVLPDIVFLDLKMPEFTGFEVLAWVQTQPGLADLKIVVLSGSEDATDIQRATALGALACFTKPIQVDQMQTVMQAFAVPDPLANPRPLASNIGVPTPAE